MNTDAHHALETAPPGADESEDPPSAPSDKPAVEVIDRSSGASVDAAWLRRKVRDAATLAPRPVGSVSIVLVSDADMVDLHARFRGERSITDVLSFDWSVEGMPVEAEIVICVDVARRQARARAHAVERELLLYAVHGLLHCCGFDDHDVAASRRMHALEDDLLDRIGVGRTFAAGEGRP